MLQRPPCFHKQTIFSQIPSKLPAEHVWVHPSCTPIWTLPLVFAALVCDQSHPKILPQQQQHRHSLNHGQSRASFILTQNYSESGAAYRFGRLKGESRPAAPGEMATAPRDLSPAPCWAVPAQSTAPKASPAPGMSICSSNPWRAPAPHPSTKVPMGSVLFHSQQLN